MELLFGARLRRSEVSVSQSHSHDDFWQIEYCLRGPIEYEVAGNRHALTEGAILVIPPGHAHRQTSPKASDSYLLKLRRPDDRAIVQPTLVLLTGPERQRAEQLLAAVIYEHDGRAADRERMIGALIEQLLIWVKRWSGAPLRDRRSASPSGARERVRLLGDMLRREYARRFSVDALARRACLSRSRFLELFRKEFGLSPIAFHARMRMEKAVELAQYTGMSWQQIARQLGYDDPAYFSRAFKKAMGASPSHFLRAR